MSIIRATKKLIDTSKAKPQPEPALTTAQEEVGVWFAQLLSSSFQGKFFVLYTHKPSLMCVLAKGKTIQTTFSVFSERLEKLLTRFSFPKPFIDYMLNYSTKDYVVCKTKDRQQMGYINSICAQLDARFYDYENFDGIDVDEEENILMAYLHSIDSKKQGQYFTPIDYWNNFFAGNAVFKDKFDDKKHKSVVKLKDGFEDFTREEKLESENALLKLKLETEFGAVTGDGSFEGKLALENQWLNYIYNFEKMHKDANLITIHEALGKPEFKEASTFTPAELKREIKKVVTKLAKKSVAIDFLNAYDDVTIYDFLTKELVLQQIDDVRMPGLMQSFIYEDFHPNHESDLERASEDFIANILVRDARASLHEGEFYKTLSIDGKEVTLDEFKEIITIKVEEINPSELKDIKVLHVEYDLELAKATVKVQFVCMADNLIGKRSKITQNLQLDFVYDLGYWYITSVLFLADSK